MSPNDSKTTPDDIHVDLDAEFKASNIQELLDQLDRELIGLKPNRRRRSK
jgi:hypothetical protein